MNEIHEFKCYVRLQSQEETNWWRDIWAASHWLEKTQGASVDGAPPRTDELREFLRGPELGTDEIGLPLCIKMSEHDDDVAWVEVGCYGNQGYLGLCAEAVSWFLRTFARTDAVVFSWAEVTYCRVGGGTVRVTADSIKFVSTEDLERLAEDGDGPFS